MGSDWDGKERRRIDKGKEIRGRILKAKRRFERDGNEPSQKPQAPSNESETRTTTEKQS
jgi:hypothetical protein